jgi:hypothetical protein
MNELKLQPDLPIANLKTQFNKLFPYLKLEFFSSEHGSNEGSPKKDLINDSTLLSEVGVTEESTFEVSSKSTPSQLEEQFKTKFGGNMQVFWKSGRIWLETIQYDDLALSELNRHAEERTEHIV